MAVRPVLQLPDPVLKQAAVTVTEVDSHVVAVLDDLVQTMRAAPACVGLAAPQIGESRRAFVVDVTGHPKAQSAHGVIELVNPELIEATDPVMAREGCMSVPHLTGDVVRPSRVVVRGLGRDGLPVVVEADAFEARALLHELDHLDGVLFLDRVSSHSSVFRRRVWR